MEGGNGLRSRGYEVRILAAAQEVRSKFERKVDRSAGEDGCWPWKPSVDRDGYGKFYIGSRTLRASRIALILHLGRDLAADKLALHLCDNPRCVNPAHLYEGSHVQNMWDKIRRGRTRSAKLTPAQVIEIRKYAPLRRYSEIAEKYGISESHVGHIVTGQKWRSLLPEQRAA